MKTKIIKTAFFSLLLIVCIAVSLLCRTRTPNIDGASNMEHQAKIKPDYCDTVIPPNIAPLNFVVLNKGREYFVEIHATNGRPVKVFSKTGKIKIPQTKWHKLLSSNRGEKLYFDIYVKDNDGLWHRYKPLTNTIAGDDIDKYIAYRLMKPIYNWWHSIGVYQRDLQGYSEKVILHGRNFRMDCVNCHSFLKNSGENMFIGIRSALYGSSAIHASGTDAAKVGTKFGYTAWHPSGKLVVYSINKVRQFFHNAGLQVRDVVDLDSALCYYTIPEQKVKTNKAFADPNRLETYPAWAPDGKCLYFCSAAIPWKDDGKLPPVGFENVRYDLMRIDYDIESDQWGQPEKVLSADEVEGTILLPRISPDGKFLVFCIADYGCFPIYRPTSDLYLMDIDSKKYRKLEINSNHSESWHSFSSNSRWMAFSSKREGGLFTRTYLTYIDKDGKAYKPFIMPQKNPLFYDSYLKTYSVPELISTPVQIHQTKLARIVRSDKYIKADIPLTGATPKLQEAYPPQQERE